MWLIEKDPDAGKDWGQKEREVRENKMVGWHRQLNGHEFEQTPGDRRKGKPRMLQSLGSQIVGRDLATEQRKQCQRTLPRHITVTLLNVSKKKILKKSTEKEKLCTREKG